MLGVRQVIDADMVLCEKSWQKDRLQIKQPCSETLLRLLCENRLNTWWHMSHKKRGFSAGAMYSSAGGIAKGTSELFTVSPMSG